jgi:hypothetical protein
VCVFCDFTLFILCKFYSWSLCCQSRRYWIIIIIIIIIISSSSSISSSSRSSSSKGKGHATTSHYGTKGGSNIALPSHNLRAGKGWVLNTTPGVFYRRERGPVLIVQEVWFGFGPGADGCGKFLRHLQSVAVLPMLSPRFYSPVTCSSSHIGLCARVCVCVCVRAWVPFSRRFDN